MEISAAKLLVVAIIIGLLFGTQKLRSLGSDLGEAIKGFKKALRDETPSPDETTPHATQTATESQHNTTPINDVKKTDE